MPTKSMQSFYPTKFLRNNHYCYLNSRTHVKNKSSVTTSSTRSVQLDSATCDLHTMIRASHSKIRGVKSIAVCYVDLNVVPRYPEVLTVFI